MRRLLSRLVATTFTSQGSWSGWLGWVAVLLGFMAVVLLGAWLWSRRLERSHPARESMARSTKWGLAVVALGLLVLAVRSQGALYLSSPLIFIGWVILFGWWLSVAGDWWIRRYPRELEEYREARRRGRWLGRRRAR